MIKASRATTEPLTEGIASYIPPVRAPQARAPYAATALDDIPARPQTVTLKQRKPDVDYDRA